MPCVSMRAVPIDTTEVTATSEKVPAQLLSDLDMASMPESVKVLSKSLQSQTPKFY